MATNRSGTARRGMLLLMVLLMLSLFMAIGAMLLTLAMRSRSAARAALATSEPSSQSDTLIRDALDEALMAALRGSRSGTNGSVTPSGTFYENLLLDRYGSPLATGSGTILSATSVPPAPAGTGAGLPVLPLSLTQLSPPLAQPAKLNGRILTIVPRTGDGDVRSFRILAATGTSGTAGGITTCLLAQLPSTTPRPLPTGTFGVVVNGREFTPDAAGMVESYDAYDDANIWLAQPEIDNGQVSGTFPRLSFVGTSGILPSNNPVVDNDNDGVADGAWMPSDTVLNAAIAAGLPTPPPFVLPDRPSPLGGTLRFQVSYLILDLDGRINVNTAGIAAPHASVGDEYDDTPPTPVGMGYGPADINVSALFPIGAGQNVSLVSGTPSPVTLSSYWQDLLLTGTPSLQPSPPSPAQRRTPPVVGRIEGRYGSNAVPSGPGDQTASGQRTASTMYTLSIAGSNAIGDLKAQTRVYITPPATGQIMPTLNFYRPTWSGTAGSDHVDDPYEARLDTDAPRQGAPRRPPPVADRRGANPNVVNANDDLPFTLAELERILRPNDPDASQLPQRLAAGLEDQAQRNRVTITTDSWDTPGLTGLAAVQIENFLSANPLLRGTGTSTYDPSIWTSGSAPLSPDVAAGLRFDINRPVLSGTTAAAVAQQQEYCKGLYTLVMALGAPDAAAAAQWAANVLDFRDEDSTMTRFAYDTNLADGWLVNASSPVVFGAERPEVVITETGAWRDDSNGQLFVVLHRPAAQALKKDPATATSANGQATEMSSNDLVVSGTLNLARMIGGSPIWRLRFGSNKFVQFNDIGASPPANVYGSATASGTVALVANGYLCVCPSSPTRFTPAVTQFNVDRPTATGFKADGSKVWIERLADPSRPEAADNPYMPVDVARVNAIDVAAGGNPNVTKLRRTGPTDVAAGADPDDNKRRHALFWKNGNGDAAATVWPGNGQLVWQTDNSATLGAYSAASVGNPVAWYHWPNRGFIGNAELAMVPVSTGTSSTAGALAEYSFPTNSLANSAHPVTVSGSTTTLGALILDATTVPSRFADNAVTMAHPSIAAVGLDTLNANHLSKWREPGRVNVNTLVLSSSFTTPVSPSTDDIVWQIVIGGTSTTNPWTPKPATSSTIPAVPAIPASATEPHRPAIPAIPGNQPRQPAQPAMSLAAVLSLDASGTTGIRTDDFTTTVSGTLFPRDKNPYFSLARAIRLSNTATVRSNVFAIWITVKVTDDSPNAPSPVTRRIFAIVDRSIPVGYRHNRDLNVRETIKIKRFLD